MTRALRVALLGVAVGVSIAACIDVEGGETGVYGSPCGTGFTALLRCGLEGGGGDPAGGGTPGEPSEGAATCADACAVVVMCQGGDPSDLAECNSGCAAEPVPQQLLDCIVAMGCNFPACLPDN